MRHDWYHLRPNWGESLSCTLSFNKALLWLNPFPWGETFWGQGDLPVPPLVTTLCFRCQDSEFSAKRGKLTSMGLFLMAEGCTKGKQIVLGVQCVWVELWCSGWGVQPWLQCPWSCRTKAGVRRNGTWVTGQRISLGTSKSQQGTPRNLRMHELGLQSQYEVHLPT